MKRIIMLRGHVPFRILKAGATSADAQKIAEDVRLKLVEQKSAFTNVVTYSAVEADPDDLPEGINNAIINLEMISLGRDTVTGNKLTEANMKQLAADALVALEGHR